MPFSRRELVLVKSRAKSYYERWIEKEALPVWRGFGANDIRAVPLGECKRLNCKGAYLQLPGLHETVGVYVMKIAPGGSLEPERHLYEEIIYVVEGEGVAEIQQRGYVPQSFRWQAGSLFSPPLNTTHRLINQGSQPAFILAVTTAPLVLDHFHNEKFVFDSDFAFSDRYAGDVGYFESAGERYLCAEDRQTVWETNFIPDVRTVLDEALDRAKANSVSRLEMCDNTLVGHLSLWPEGRAQKAYCESTAALQIMLRSEGYTLMWPRECGVRPFENGYGKQVVRMDWRPGSLLCPPTHWFRQHFNTGIEPALHLVLGCRSRKLPFGNALEAEQPAVSMTRNESSVIEFTDEDPEMRRRYEAELHRKGVIYNVAANEA